MKAEKIYMVFSLMSVTVPCSVVLDFSRSTPRAVSIKPQLNTLKLIVADCSSQFEHVSPLKRPYSVAF